MPHARARLYHKRSVRSASTLSSSRAPAARRRGRTARRILAAAAEAFAEHGLEVPVDEIARRAGVGMGTLYRRFPTKAALVEAIFEEHLDRLAALAEEALRDDDPWRGLRRLPRAHGRAAGREPRLRGDRGHAPARREAARRRAQAGDAARARELIERAQAAGVLRPDIVHEDISVLFWTSARVVDATRDVAPEFWRRHLTLALDGLRRGRDALPHPPLTRRSTGRDEAPRVAVRRLLLRLRQGESAVPNSPGPVPTHKGGATPPPSTPTIPANCHMSVTALQQTCNR